MKNFIYQAFIKIRAFLEIPATDICKDLVIVYALVAPQYIIVTMWVAVAEGTWAAYKKKHHHFSQHIIKEN